MSLLSPRRLLAALALAALLISWLAVLETRSGLTVRRDREAGQPFTFLAPQSARGTPGILVAHGFGGSQQLMLGYATVLARAGYAVMLWDFAGHAANANRLDVAGDSLARDLDRAYERLIAQPEVDAARVGLLGHSMGSGAVLRAGNDHPERYVAVVAVSPVAAIVTPDRPPNLLLQAGAWEPRFADNARRLLEEAGGPNDDLAGRRGRALTIVPQVEHILILFSRESHEGARRWFDRAFEMTAATASYVDRRLPWYGVQVVAALLLAVAVAPALRRREDAGQPPMGGRRAAFALVPAPFLASGAVALLHRFIPVDNLAGLVVGGGLALWFFALGAIWLVGGGLPPRPPGRDGLRGLALFAFLWLAVGALAHFVWLPWLLIPARLVWWLPLSLLCLPWLLAAGRAQAGRPAGTRVLWWLAHSGLVIAGLLVLITLVPELGVLILLLPVLPAVLGLMAAAGAVADAPWAYALGNALFFGWLLLAYFPLA